MAKSFGFLAKFDLQHKQKPLDRQQKSVIIDFIHKTNCYVKFGATLVRDKLLWE